MFRSIQFRITVSFILIILVSMGVLGVYLANSFRNSHLDSLRTQLENEARIIVEASLPIITQPENQRELDILAKNLGGQIDARITIIALDGTVLGDSEQDPAIMDNHASRPEVQAALTSGLGESTRYSITLGQKMMYIAVPVTSQGEVLGVSRVSLSVSTVESLVNRTVVVIIIAMLVAAAVVIVAGWLVTRTVTRPIRRVTRAAGKIAGGELGQKIKIESRDEAGELARAFNRMSSKVKELIGAISTDRIRLESILDNRADGVVMTDIEGRVMIANRAAANILQFKDIAGKSLMREVREHEINDVFKACTESGKEQTVQFETVASKKYLSVIVVPLADVQPEGVLLLLQDLTELKGLQTTRRELIGNISHEFRTPLAGIKAMVETLHDGAIDDKKVAADFLSRIDDEVDRLTQMVSELTELSRIETGKAELELEKAGLNRLADEVVVQISPLTKRKKLNIIKELAADLPDVYADRARIRQVIVNLLHNAIKFTPAAGEIKITTTSTKDSVNMDISDSGNGIAAEDLPRIFQRFYKADRARAGEGTGLGLAIVKHIIESHNGTIRAESTEGQGSTFSFSLPLK